MAWPTSSFPASLDSITRKTDTTDEIVADDHNGAYDCIEHLEAKVGVDGSTVTTSLDYLLKNTSSINPGHKHTLANGATDVTASAAEVNLIDGSVAGTAVANKALVLGANKNVDTLVIADSGLKLGTGTGTAITATASEINSACDGAASSIGTNGYIKTVSGLIIQWGSYSALASDIRTITFPLAFPNAVLHLGHLHSMAGNGYVPRATYKSLSQMDMNNDNWSSGANPSGTHYWLAIGY